MEQPLIISGTSRLPVEEPTCMRRVYDSGEADSHLRLRTNQYSIPHQATRSAFTLGISKLNTEPACAPAYA